MTITKCCGQLFFEKPTKILIFAQMKLLWKHSGLFRKTLAYALVGLFLWANYGISHTSLHQHEHTEHHHDEDGSHKHLPHGEDCLVCDFQSLVYTPLVQVFTNISEHQPKSVYSIPFHRVIASLFGVYHISFLRGPPAVA